MMRRCVVSTETVHCFPEQGSGYAHAFPARILPALMDDDLGLDPAHAVMDIDVYGNEQTIRGVWLQPAEQRLHEFFLNHTQKRKKCHTVLAVLFPQYHPAISALMRCKNNQLYSLINLPLNGTTIVRLN